MVVLGGRLFLMSEVPLYTPPAMTIHETGRRMREACKLITLEVQKWGVEESDRKKPMIVSKREKEGDTEKEKQISV